MDIRFVSSLTPEDEARLAPALVQAFGSLLDQFPIAYTLRIETSGSLVFQHSHTGLAVDDDDPDVAETARPVFASLGSMLRSRAATT